MQKVGPGSYSAVSRMYKTWSLFSETCWERWGAGKKIHDSSNCRRGKPQREPGGEGQRTERILKPSPAGQARERSLHSLMN